MRAEKESEWLLAQRERAWMDGGSAVAVIELLIEMGRPSHAAAVGRLALTMPEAAGDHSRIEELLETVESTPAGWDAAIAHFAASPSRESWDAIICFAPLERIYDWVEKAVRQLVRTGCDANAIIRYGSQTGMTPGMIRIVEEGRVSAETLVERAAEPGAAGAIWLGLAAQAAWLHGDRFRAIALFRDALACETDLSSPDASILWLREHADEEMETMMRKAGVWDRPW